MKTDLTMNTEKYHCLINHHIDYLAHINKYFDDASEELLLSLKYQWKDKDKQLFDKQLFDEESVISTYSSFIYFYPGTYSNKERSQKFVNLISSNQAFKNSNLQKELTYDTVFIALNAGSGGENHYFNNFENFHYNGSKPSASKAYSLHKFIYNKRSHLHGSYITDAFKGLATSDGNELNSAFSKIENEYPNFTENIIDAYVDALIDELNTLGANPKIIYSLGKTKLLKTFMSKFKTKWSGDSKFININHYAATGSRSKEGEKGTSRDENWAEFLE